MEQLLKKKISHPFGLKKIRGEASSRIFYRIFFESYSQIAMVYPQEEREEIKRIIKLTSVYKNNGIRVPTIFEVIDHQIVLQEDLGDLSLQRAFLKLRVNEKKEILVKIAEILQKLSRVNFANQDLMLDNKRMKWEMDFFIKHFALRFFSPRFSVQKLQMELYTIVDNIKKITKFAHRDFHSRNMLYHKSNICLVDFQDSLKGPIYYDLVSFAYDSYLDLKSLREFFFQIIEDMKFSLDYEQIFLTALQRNLKALGTFGYQVTEKKNLNYKKYINRTIRHILGNKMIESSFSYGSELFKSYNLKQN